MAILSAFAYLTDKSSFWFNNLLFYLIIVKIIPVRRWEEFNICLLSCDTIKVRHTAKVNTKSLYVENPFLENASNTADDVSLVWNRRDKAFLSTDLIN